MDMRVASKVVLCLLYILPASAKDIDYETARLEKRLHPMKITDKITIDGRLDELVWTDAPRAVEFTQREPEEGEQASEQTEVRVLYDQENLYFGVTAKDSEVRRAIIAELKKDFSVDNGDSFQIVLDTFHDERNAYQFIINPAGAKWDAQIANEGREVNQSWDGVWYVKARMGDDG
jgi:Carbohydrate family 9 binding domain-like